MQYTDAWKARVKMEVTELTKVLNQCENAQNFSCVIIMLCNVHHVTYVQ